MALDLIAAREPSQTYARINAAIDALNALTRQVSEGLNAAGAALAGAIEGERQSRISGLIQEGKARTDGFDALAGALDIVRQNIADGLTQAEQATVQGLAALQAAVTRSFDLEAQRRIEGLTQEGDARREGLESLAGDLAMVRRNLSDGLTQAERARAAGDAALADSIVTTVSAEAQRRIEAVAAGLAQALNAVTAEAGARAEGDTILARGLVTEGRDRAAGDAAERAERIAGDEASLDAVDELRRDVIEGLVSRFRSGRPGDNRIAFTLANAFGAASDLPALPARYVANSDLGAVARFSEAAILSSRDAFPIDPGRVIQLRFAVRRFADSPDPSNEGVVVRASWMDQSKTPLGSGSRFTEIARLLNLKVSDGLVTVRGVVASTIGPEVTIVPPYGARYGRLQVQLFGSTHTTDVILLDSDDITAAQVLPAASADLADQVASLRSQSLDPRVAVLEQTVGSPLSKTFRTVNDARAATIDPSIQAINLLGINAAADGRGRLFKRFPGATAPNVGTWFQTVDGAYWLSIRQWLLGDDLDLGSAAPAVHGSGYPARPNAVPYTWTDRFGEQYVEPHALVSTQATSGLQGDQDAISAARDIARSRWTTTGRATPVLFSRPFDPIGETAFDFPVHITGTSSLMAMTPRATIRSVFSLVAGLSTVSDFKVLNPIDPSVVLDFTQPEISIAGGAAAFVRVEKRVSSDEVTIRDVEASGYPVIVDWRDGTNPRLINIKGTKCGLVAYFRNSGMNGRCDNLQNEFGGGIRVQKDANRAQYGYGPAGDGVNGGVQQMEGTAFYTLKISQTVDPAFGYKDPPVMLVDSGYSLKFFDFQPQELVWSTGLLIKALVNSIADIDIVSVFINTNSTAIATRPQNVFDAITIVGSVKGVRIMMGRISDMLGRAISVNGKSALDTAADIDISRMRFERNALGDVLLRNASGVLDKNVLSSPAGSLDEDDSCEFEGRNWYRAKPTRISKYSDWSGGRGPGAPVGIPTAGMVAGDPKFTAGKFYTGEADGIVRISGR